MRKIQLKRGQKSNMPILSQAELGFAIDEETLYIGTGNQNIPLAPKAHTHTAAELSGTIIPSAHKVSHKTGGSDALTASDIGAASKFLLNAGWKKIASYETAGTYTWKVPNLFDGKPYRIGVLIIGGGSSGSVRIENIYSGYSPRSCSAASGSSGFSTYFTMTVAPNQTYNLVVGMGGAKATASTIEFIAGSAGGTSSFDGKLAIGGSNTGGQPALSVQGLFGGVFYINEYGQNQYMFQPLACFNPFENKRILGSGGSAQVGWDGTMFNNINHEGGKDPTSGLGGGNGLACQENGTQQAAQSGTAAGCGGGGMVKIKTASGQTIIPASSGAGADGAVYIYVQGVDA